MLTLRSKFAHAATRFLSKIEFPGLADGARLDLSKVNTADCWLWKASVTESGYGRFRHGDKTKRAHRVSYEIFIGDVPAGLLTLHRCDIRHCVNPFHLFLGTQKENQEDMTRKGRGRSGDRNWLRRNPDKALAAVQYMLKVRQTARGERVSLSKLTEAQIREIRELHKQGFGCHRLAKRFNMGTTAIKCILNRTTWKHVD